MWWPGLTAQNYIVLVSGVGKPIENWLPFFLLYDFSIFSSHDIRIKFIQIYEKHINLIVNERSSILFVNKEHYGQGNTDKEWQYKVHPSGSNAWNLENSEVNPRYQVEPEGQPIANDSFVDGIAKLHTELESYGGDTASQADSSDQQYVDNNLEAVHWEGGDDILHH